MDRRNFLSTALASAALAAPLAVSAMPATSAFVRAATGPDAEILAAWERHVAAYALINAPGTNEDPDTPHPAWAIADAADKIIQGTLAKTPEGVEIQIWTSLHNSSAYTTPEEQAILARDIEYIEANAVEFDWQALPMIMAIRSLRAMPA